jgi:hypothetical protein
LEESERKLAAAARLPRVRFWETDIVANRVSWSEEACHVLGMPGSERTRSWDELLALVHVEDRPRLEEPQPREVNAQELRGTETVLVLEDQREVRKLIERTLRRYGYTVIVGSNGSGRARRGASPRWPDPPGADRCRPPGGQRTRDRAAGARRSHIRAGTVHVRLHRDVIVRHGILEPGPAFIEPPRLGAGSRCIDEIVAEIVQCGEPIFQGPYRTHG